MKSSLIWHKRLKIQIPPVRVLKIFRDCNKENCSRVYQFGPRQRDRRAVYLSSFKIRFTHDFLKKSSRRQRDLAISRLKREELEKQHEIKLRIARQRPFLLCMRVCVLLYKYQIKFVVPVSISS